MLRSWKYNITSESGISCVFILKLTINISSYYDKNSEFGIVEEVLRTYILNLLTYIKIYS